MLVGESPEAVLHEAMRVAHVRGRSFVHCDVECVCMGSNVADHQWMQSLRQRGLSVHFCHGRGNLKKQMKVLDAFALLTTPCIAS